TITFRLGTDLDEAQVLVQNRVSIAEPRLPEEVRRLGITARKNSPDFLMVVHLLSPDKTYDELYVSNYALLQVKDVLARLEGVGGVQVFGAREYSMRVWMDPDKIAALGLTAPDVIAAIRAQNTQVAGGTLGAPPVAGNNAFTLNLNLQGRLEDVEAFKDIIVRTGEGGQVVRLRDVARVELGARDYVTNSYLDHDQAVGILVTQRPGSNALDTADRVKQTMETLRQAFPKGLEYRIVYNPTEFISASIKALVKTILEAIALVVAVVLLFLQRWRAAIIPVLAIPVSLVGTFSVMAAFGFSINSLTLFGLVLAVGIVVDDAIVVVENVERNLSAGMKIKDAARRTMDEVGGALISIALVLCAVFVPTAFISGLTGQFYRQFALTISVATVISAFVSLTLSPALASLLLKAHTPHDPESPPSGGFVEAVRGFLHLFDRGFEHLGEWYGRIVRRVIHRPKAMLAVYCVLIALTAAMFMRTPTGFIPMQDQGYLIAAVQLPDGASLERTDAVVRRIIDMAKETPGIRDAVGFSGFSGATFTFSSNTGVIFTPLVPWEERLPQGRTLDVIQAELSQKVAAIQEGLVFVIPPPPVPGVGTGGGFSMRLQDRAGLGPDALFHAAFDMMMKANGIPGLTGVFTPFTASAPQLFVDVDRTRARMLGVPVSDLFQTLEIYLGSSYVNDFNLLGRTYTVTAQADAPFRQDRENILRLKVRNAHGDMVPLGSLVSFRDIVAPDRVPRYNLFPAAEISGSTLPGVSSGQAMESMEKLAAEILPPGIGYEWTDLSYQQKMVGNTAMYIFVLCVVFVFLVLAAQYESWTLPLAIILIVPMCLLSAISGVGWRGMDNNVLTQIGFIVLIGLASKNAILIVEFARHIEEHGKDRFEAVIEACRLRLRPILMTSLAFILGVVPLLTATGAGAEMRQAIGTAVFFGMLGVTFFGLVFTPVFYTVIRGWAVGRSRPE
ncbi:MAG: multidrug efflux RND transporter permease subunit, partial [Pseudomonadota bacterium]|nr:multidrug efflux RND transporter permease subunit [Pseudomonadota bacterium]